MFEKLCSRTFSSASNCQFFLWLWPPPKKRDLWNSDRGLYGKAQREKKTEEQSEGVPKNQCEGRAGCQTHRSVDLSIQHGSAESKRGHPPWASGPFTHTTRTPRIYAPGKSFHSAANVLFIWETPRPDCFHNLPNLSCVSKRLVKAYLALVSFQVNWKMFYLQRLQETERPQTPTAGNETEGGVVEQLLIVKSMRENGNK